AEAEVARIRGNARAFFQAEIETVHHDRQWRAVGLGQSRRTRALFMRVELGGYCVDGVHTRAQKLMDANRETFGALARSGSYANGSGNDSINALASYSNGSQVSSTHRMIFSQSE